MLNGPFAGNISKKNKGKLRIKEPKDQMVI
jgi:hypothetical protein